MGRITPPKHLSTSIFIFLAFAMGILAKSFGANTVGLMILFFALVFIFETGIVDWLLEKYLGEPFIKKAKRKR